MRCDSSIERNGSSFDASWKESLASLPNARTAAEKSHRGQRRSSGESQALASCQSRNTVWREWAFTFRLPTLQAGEDFTVVQGLIDVLVWTPGGLVVIDFKTDHVSGEGVQRRAEAYRGQVELYARAAHEILKHPVVNQWLYFLTPRQAVRM